MERPERKAPEQSLAGAIAMIVLGLLIFVPSGLCTGAFTLVPLIDLLANPGQQDGAWAGIWIIALIVGGPFVFLGGYLLRIGLRSYGEWRRQRD